MRIRAIFCCLYFGIMPSPVYEKRCHYRRGYWKHMYLNLEQILIWIFFRDTQSDREFEAEVNPSWSVVFGKLFRWQRGAEEKFETIFKD